MLTPEEIRANQEAEAFLRENQAGRRTLRKMPYSEIKDLIAAAAIVGNGRAEGLSDGETIARFARELANENDRRRGVTPERIAAVERDLREQGLAPDDLEAKNAREMLQDEAIFGFADEEDAFLAQDGDGKRYREDGLRKGLAKVRK